MHYTVKIMGLLLLVAALESGCKKETDCTDPTNMECSNYNPCYGQTALTSAFTMEETIGFGFLAEPYRATYPQVTALVQDTALQTNVIVFKALEEASRYEWTIGSDPRVFRDRTVSLHFFAGQENLTPTTLNVTLRTYRESPQSCYPEDTAAVATRQLTIVSRENILLEGSYKGVSTFAPNDSFVVHIQKDTISGSGFDIKRLMPGCVRYNPMQSIDGYPLKGIGYSKAMFENTMLILAYPDCYRMQGFAELAENRQDIRIQYYLKDNPNGDEVFDEFVFTGTRIN